MKIELLAPPFSGHLHPILSIARALTTEHEIVVLSTLSVQVAIEACGLQGEVILTTKDEQLLWAIANPPHPVKANPVRMHRQLKQALKLMACMRQALHQRWMRRRPDLVIADFTLPPAGLLAQELGIPWWTSLPSPCVMETPNGPPAYLGGLIPSQHLGTEILHHIARLTTRGFKRAMHFWFHREMLALGLPHIYRADGTEAVYSRQCILALGVRELEFERLWPAAVQFVGPMLCTPPRNRKSPPFQHGKRHLLVTAGTHLDWAKNRLAEEARKLALRYPNWVVHVTDGHADAPSASLDRELPNFQRLPFVDYERHIHKYDLLLHHGGAGIMYHAIKAGIPSLVHPWDYDQFDHAARIEAHGVGLWVKRLEDLPAAFARALERPDVFHNLSLFQQVVQQQVDKGNVSRLVNALERGESLSAAID